MPLDHLAIDRISEADLQALIDNGVAEGRDIEFKAQSWGHADRDKHEFLADVSAFANTVGGHIVVGMQEKGGIAHALAGLSINPDQERLRLEQLARDGLQPRIGGLQIAAVELANRTHALVLRIPRSWNPPHRVVAQGRNRFYARASNGRYEPDVDQLRELFAVAPTLAEKVRDFRFDRLAKIRAGEVPLRNRSQGALILHVVSYDAFSRPRRLSIAELRGATSSFPLLGEGALGSFSPPNFRPNLDGLRTVSTSRASAEPQQTSHVQIWRSGQIEATCDGLLQQINLNDRYISIDRVETASVVGLQSYLEALRTLDVTAPYAVFLTLLDVHAKPYRSGRGEHWHLRGEFSAADIPTSDVLAETVPNLDDQTVATLLRPAFDEIANAAGLDASPNFDRSGRWQA